MVTSEYLFESPSAACISAMICLSLSSSRSISTFLTASFSWHSATLEGDETGETQGGSE